MPTKLSRYTEAVIELCALAALVLVPVFFDVHSARVFEPDKLTLLRSIALVAVVAWVVRALELGRGAWDNRAAGEQEALESPVRRLIRAPLFLPTLLLVIVYLIATLFSIAPATSLWGSYQRLQGTYTTFSYIVIFAIIATVLRRREQIDRLVTATILASVPICLYAIIQHNQLDPLPWGGDVTQRVASNMGNAIFVAAYLIMVVPLTLGRVVTSFHAILTEKTVVTYDVVRAALYIFILLIQAITIFWSGSRGPWLGLMVSVWVLALFGLLMLRRSSAGRGVVRLADVGLAIGGVVTANLVAAAVVALIVVAATSLGVLRGSSPEQLFAYQIGLGTLGALGLSILLTLALALSRRTWRWVWLAAVLQLVFIIGFLGVLNIKNGPLQFARSGAYIQRMAEIFEVESGTGKVRTLIWEGAFQLITPHAPLAFPDGREDTWNAIRPLIGYGPESMYVAYNSFYPPELAHVESRNASPDRSHNETFDSLVISGVFGLTAYLFLFGSVFYFGYRWLGWIGSRRTTWLFIGLWVFGSLAGALIPIAIGQPKFLGVAVPAAVIAMALILYVMLYALFRYGMELRAFLLLSAVVGLAAGAFGAAALGQLWPVAAGLAAALLVGFALYRVSVYAFADFEEPVDEMTFEQRFLLVALVSAVMGHFVEINMGGIAIAATRTLFWAFAGMMVVIGYVWPRARQASEAQAAMPEPETVAVATSARRRKRRGVTAPGPARRETPGRREGAASGMRRWLGPTVAVGMVLAMMLLTMGFELINNQRQPPATTATDIVWQSLLVLPPYQGRVGQQNSPTTLLMFVATWVIGAVLLVSELGKARAFRESPGSWRTALWVVLGVSGATAVLFALIQASGLLSVNSLGTAAFNAKQYTLGFTRIADGFASLLSLYYIAIFGILFLGAAALLSSWSLPAPAMRPLGAVAGAVLLIVALFLVVRTNLNVIQADIVYKNGDALDKQASGLAGSAQQVSQVLGQLAALAAQLSATNPAASQQLSAATSALQRGDFDGGRQALQQVAQALTNDPTAAQIVSQAERAAEQAQQRLIYWESAVGVYRHALELAPNEDYYYLFLGRAYLEYATATVDTAKQDQLLGTARDELRRAQQINPLNTDHTANLARLHRRWAELAERRGSPPERVAELLAEANKYYGIAAETLSPNNAVIWTEWCDLHSDNLKDFEGARQRCEKSLTIDEQYDQTWVVLGDAYILHANAITGTVPLENVELLYADAARYYRGAAALMKTRGQNDRAATYFNTACLMGYQGRAYEAAAISCQDVITLSLTTVPGLRTDPGLWNTYRTLMLSYEGLGDQCRTAGDTACAQERYTRAVESGNAALQLAPPGDQAALTLRLAALEQKRSEVGGTAGTP